MRGIGRRADATDPFRAVVGVRASVPTGMLDPSAEKLSYEAEVLLHAWVSKHADRLQSDGIVFEQVALSGQWPNTKLRFLWRRSDDTMRQASVPVWRGDGSARWPADTFVLDVLQALWEGAIGGPAPGSA
jgi:hypothetical protein